ncbi:putative membrane protein [Edaphobacter aggregans]|uniref:Putative membrane protein n=1 Tax=Edaphobacter aggregans TaxID=570835 RepID=A0A428MH00_9BACT|nr:DUF4870 domain-containing protein [Edaphobacter aggregans]RSL16196.1 putative membrane protein [Edaphobacter aggregans]
MSDPMQDPIPPQQPPPTYIPPASTSSGLSDNLAAALAYVTIIPAIIFLVLEPYNRIPLIRFHSFQSIGFCILAFVLQVILTIAEGLLRFIPGSWMLFSICHLLLGLGLFVAWLIVILKASRGEWYKLPIIGDFAEKQARS